MVKTILLGLMITGVMPVTPLNPKESSKQKVIAVSSIINNNLISPCVAGDFSANCSARTTVSDSNLWRGVANVLLPGSSSNCTERSPDGEGDKQLLLGRDRQVQNPSNFSENFFPSIVSPEQLSVSNVLISLGRSTRAECIGQSSLNQIDPSRLASNAKPQNTSSASVSSPKFPKLSRSSLIVSLPPDNSSFVPQNPKLANPAPESERIASPFGWRKRPYSNQLQFHQGIDYGAPYGSPVVAIGNGIVTKVVSGCTDFGSLFCGGQLGNWIEIDHGDGAIGTYGHLKNSSITVREGMKVQKNQNIALVGSSGWSTGAHLDFRLKVNGEHEDPAKYVMSIGQTKNRLSK